MAREVIVNTLCDPCLAEDVRTEGRELPAIQLPGVPGKAARVVAVCERHDKELLQPLVALLTEHGQAVDAEGQPTSTARGNRRGKANNQEAMTCPVCGHSSPNRGALASHARNMHDAALGELLGEATLTCPECGRLCSRPQGLAAHRRSAHGITPNGGDQGDQDQPSLLEDKPPARKKAPAKRARKKPTT